MEKLTFEKMCEAINTILDEENIFELQNTFGSDINEIYVGYFVLGETWDGFENGQEARAVVEKRKLQIDDEQSLNDQIGRAKAMSEEILKWAADHKYEGNIRRVWWVGRRHAILSKIVGYDVDFRKNPTDILLQFDDEGFLGISAKSTKGSKNIGIKNPGIGSLSKAIGLDLVSTVKERQKEIIQKHNLPLAQGKRKIFIRSNPEIKDEMEKLGSELLKTLRDSLFDHYNKVFSDEEMKKHILSVWLDSEGILPNYIKVTGHGKNGNYTASIYDPIKNEKINALSADKVSITPLADNSIGVLAGNERIFKIRFKYESEKLASSIKLSGDSW